MTTTKKETDISAIPLLDRKVYGDYVVYTVLSSDGVTKYQTTLRDGKATGCTCPATIRECKHARACEFEEAWIAPIAEQVHEAAQVEQVVLAEMVAHDDVTAHVEDSIRSGEFVDPFAGMTPEQKRAAYREMYPEDFYIAA